MLKNPTLIIKPNYVDPCYPTCGGGGDPGGGDDGGNNSDNTYQLKVSEDQDTTAQVYLGQIQLKNQLDGLFRGGPDLRFIFIDVVEINPGEVEAKRIYKRLDLSRADVEEDRWLEKNELVDHRWHSYQKTLPYHVYDIDGNKTTTISIFSEVELIDGTKVEVKANYDVPKKRDNIGKLYFDRDVFLDENTTSGINGMRDGWRIYKMDHGFSSTLPHEIINLN